ncbi:unnamed protein product [Cyprideis torosa]|uniref:CSD2 domain-containing protein n=1 Tax=Cyprideis torosa TaxID=163714 RepID=A0A7R8ZM39_9CRUS|nr:unnamed protein product [Cyprideis torosa]CAG0885000.1 unnamed protein product [Cyprideis torosa]
MYLTAMKEGHESDFEASNLLPRDDQRLAVLVPRIHLHDPVFLSRSEWTVGGLVGRLMNCEFSLLLHVSGLFFVANEFRVVPVGELRACLCGSWSRDRLVDKASPFNWMLGLAYPRSAPVETEDGAADIFICGLRERNRALNGDLVAVQLLPPDKWVASTERILSSLSSMSQEDFDVVLYAARTSAAKEELIRLRQSAASEVVAPPAQGGDPTSAATPGSGLEDPAVSEGGQAPVSEHPTGPGKAPVDKRMKKPKEKAAVVVPPDELSECEDDDEFEDGSSDVGVVEDDIEDKEQMQKDVAPLVDVVSAEPSLLPVEEEAKLELQMVSQSLKLLPPDFHSDEELEDEDGVPPPMDYYSAVTHPLLPPSPGSPPDQSGSSVASHDVASDSVPSALSVMKTSSASVVSKPDEELCENVPSCDAASSPVKEPPTQSEKKVVIQFGQKTQKAAQKKGQKIKAKISFPSAPTTVSSSSLPPRGAVGGGPRTYDDPMVDSPLLEGIRNLTIERLQEKYNKLDPLDKISVVELLKLSAWKKYVQRRAKVVFILEARNPRCVAGTLKLFKDGNPTVALFSPRDARFPRLRIPMGECPPDLTVTPEKYQHTLFMALLIHWEDVGFAEGSLIRCLGDAGQIGPETDAILVAHGVETGEFSPEAMACLPKVDAVDGSWKIPEEEIRQREDFR